MAVRRLNVDHGLYTHLTQRPPDDRHSDARMTTQRSASMGLDSIKPPPDTLDHLDELAGVVAGEHAVDPEGVQVGEGAFIEARERNRAALGQVIGREVEELILGCSQLPTFKEATERLLGRLPIKPGQRAE